jgi:hypothetical protein
MLQKNPLSGIFVTPGGTRTLNQLIKRFQKREIYKAKFVLWLDLPIKMRQLRLHVPMCISWLPRVTPEIEIGRRFVHRFSYFC